MTLVALLAMPWDKILVVFILLLILVPTVSYLVARVVTTAYFNSKKQYAKSVIERITTHGK
jgi:ABC-type transport system involved in cytochrome bd biosynthesis fused ATPase/permease subunit